MADSASWGNGLRIALVTPGFSPDHGGVEAHTGHLVRELTALGVQVRVLTARRGLRAPMTEIRDGVPITRYPAWRTTIMSISPRLLLAGLRAARQADVVHVHSYHAACGFAAVTGFAAPVMFTPHYHGNGHSPQASVLHRGYRFAGKLIFRAARAIICVSRAERDAVLRDFPLAASRISVLPNGVDGAAIRAADPIPGQPPTVLSLGRLESYKRVSLLLRGLPEMPPDTQAVVIGDGSQGDELRKLAAELGITDRVRFLGVVDSHEVHRWLRTARVLVSLSEHEAFGLAPIEAAVAGARVVLSDIPAHREITADYLGPVARLIDPDPATVAAAVTEQLAGTGRAAAEAPDWRRIAEQTLAVYRAVRRPHREDARS